MKLALINPPWTFARSIYFGCKEPHLPLEYGYAKALLETAGHVAQIFDAQRDALSHAQLRTDVASFEPEIAVVTTARPFIDLPMIPIQRKTVHRDRVDPFEGALPRHIRKKRGIDR